MPLPTGNRILDTTQAVGETAILRNATLTPLSQTQFTTLRDKPMLTVDFPTTALLSVIASVEDGATAEVALVGYEGFVEIDAALHSDVARRTSVCQVAGDVVRVPIADFQKALRENKQFAACVYHAVRARVFMSEQFALCSVRHTTGARLARWLLLASDRTENRVLAQTHEQLAGILGVRRASVTVDAGALQDSGAISYSRGVVRIRDRAKLKSRACECYELCRDVVAELSPTVV
jgi:CRP-like cAMP-binding protein